MTPDEREKLLAEVEATHVLVRDHVGVWCDGCGRHLTGDECEPIALARALRAAHEEIARLGDEIERRAKENAEVHDRGTAAINAVLVAGSALADPLKSIRDAERRGRIQGREEAAASAESFASDCETVPCTNADQIKACALVGQTLRDFAAAIRSLPLDDAKEGT